MSERPFDALLPPEMAEKAEATGVKKAGLAFTPLFALSVLAGAFIALGAMLSTVTSTGANVLPYGVARLLAGFVFCLGLVLVVVGGAELFTGNNLIVMAWASRKVSTPRLLRNWAIVYVGNFVGAFATAGAVFASGQHSFAQGAVGMRALEVAQAKCALGFGQALVLGVLCNVLVCLAVWMSFAARSTIDRISAIIFPITAFVAAGFEHSIANMYFVPMGLLLRAFAPASFWKLEGVARAGKTSSDFADLTFVRFLVGNLLPVTIGNILGGGVVVGLVYWAIYLRKSA